MVIRVAVAALPIFKLQGPSISCGRIAYWRAIDHVCVSVTKLVRIGDVIVKIKMMARRIDFFPIDKSIEVVIRYVTRIGMHEDLCITCQTLLCAYSAATAAV